MNFFETSQRGIELIKKYEKYYSEAHKSNDSNFYTIGYGHTDEDVSKKLKITKEQAEALFNIDLKKNEKYVNDPSYVPIKLNQAQFDALVSYSFNCGKEKLKKLVENRNLFEIANELTEYNKQNGIILKEVNERREAEKKLFLSDIPGPSSILSLKLDNIIFQHTTILEKTKDVNKFLIGDYNHNGSFDLFYIKNFGEDKVSTEVEILDGANNYKSWLLKIETPLKEDKDVKWDFCLGDYNHDGYLDLFCIKKNKTDSKRTEVHILSGKSNFQSFILHTFTGLHETTDNCKFCVGDYNDDGKLDLFYIKKDETGTNSTEIHILSGDSEYKEFIMQTTTFLPETDNNWEFGISNYFGNGYKDLYCLERKNENEECDYIRILDGSKNYRSWTLYIITKLYKIDENFCFYPIDNQLFMIKNNGINDKVECHLLRL